MTIYLTVICHIVILAGVWEAFMGIKKITVNIPDELLESARRMTGLGITETIIEGLLEIEKREKRRALAQLKGKIAFDLNLRETRK
jgi:hypothetical protein